MQHGAHEKSESPIAENMPKNKEAECKDLLDELIDDAILGLSFEVHRAAKLNILFLDESKEDEKKYEIVDGVGLDVFGQVLMKKQFECVCPNCQYSLAASRFAPHLEKCMGMGRNSSRLASKRIANSVKVENDIDNYDDYSDWTYSSERKTTKKKRDRNSPRRSTKVKGKNASDSVNSDGSNLMASYEVMLLDDRKTLLNQVCGVVSEHTKKICTRSQRCPQHTDAQRRWIRNVVLGRNVVTDTVEEVNIDVDTVEDEGNSRRMWDSSNSANPSPVESVPTPKGSSSAAVKKKDKRVRYREYSDFRDCAT